MRSPASKGPSNGVLNPTPRLLTAADAKAPCQTEGFGAYARAEGSSGAAQSREALGFRNRSMKVVEPRVPATENVCCHVLRVVYRPYRAAPHSSIR